MDLWVTQIEEQTGSLSIETAAARFLRAHDRVALHLEAPAYLLDKWSLRCSHRTLARLAVIGGGPAFRKTGRDTLYDIASLDVWAQQKLGPAAETAAEHREIAAVMHGHAA